MKKKGTKNSIEIRSQGCMNAPTHASTNIQADEMKNAEGDKDENNEEDTFEDMESTDH